MYILYICKRTNVVRLQIFPLMFFSIVGCLKEITANRNTAIRKYCVLCIL